MNNINVVLFHKSFAYQCKDPIDFIYKNTIVKMCIIDDRLNIVLIGENESTLKNQFYKIYDLLFLMLGAYPRVISLHYNESEEDMNKWARKYFTSNHFAHAEAIICDITSANINSKSLDDMDNVNKRSISSIAYIVSEYYEHVVVDHRIELASHTIDGFFMHTKFYKILLKEKRSKFPKCKDTTFFENVERLFKIFFKYHQKYDCEILEHLEINEKDFCNIIAETRNDFSHILENKSKRLVFRKDMLYFIYLIFYAERLFILIEILELEINENMIQEYLYIMHDWIDKIVNNRDDRIKSNYYIKSKS